MLFPLNLSSLVNYAFRIFENVESLCFLQERERKLKKTTKTERGKRTKARQISHYELLQKASVSRMSETLSQAEREEQRKMEEALQELDNAPQHGAKLNQHNLQKVKPLIYVIDKNHNIVK